MEISSDIAIIGMAGVFPGAANIEQYWENILHKVNAISDAPPEWEADLFFEENTKADDRTYCKRGGFLGKLAQFDPFSFGIMPNAVDGGVTSPGAQDKLDPAARASGDLS